MGGDWFFPKLIYGVSMKAESLKNFSGYYAFKQKVSYQLTFEESETACDLFYSCANTRMEGMSFEEQIQLSQFFVGIIVKENVDPKKMLQIQDWYESMFEPVVSQISQFKQETPKWHLVL